MKRAELLKTLHQVQLNWIDNQVKKIAINGGEAFKNVEAAERAHEKLSLSLVPDNSEIEHFVDVNLSRVGIQKLVTTLRVYNKRNGAERLQVEITKTNKAKLDSMVANSSLTKIQIINLLIESADINEFKRNEEQLNLKVTL